MNDPGNYESDHEDDYWEQFSDFVESKSPSPYDPNREDGQNKHHSVREKSNSKQDKPSRNSKLARSIILI